MALEFETLAVCELNDLELTMYCQAECVVTKSVHVTLWAV